MVGWSTAVPDYIRRSALLALLLGRKQTAAAFTLLNEETPEQKHSQ
jgi:hypothetical protein